MTTTRRALLGAGLVGGAALLTGCPGDPTTPERLRPDAGSASRDPGGARLRPRRLGVGASAVPPGPGGRRTGAIVRRVPLYDDPATATVDSLATRLVEAIGPRTKVVAVTWVHSGTGVRLPIAEIGAAVADLNRGLEREDQILLCVDGVHGFAAVDVDLPDPAATCSPPAPARGCSALAAPVCSGPATGDR